MPYLSRINDVVYVTYDIRGATVEIGSSREADIVLKSRAVAPIQATLALQDQDYYLIDQRPAESSVQTLVNNRPVTSATRLSDGDRIQMAGIEFTFHDGASAEREVVFSLSELADFQQTKPTESAQRLALVNEIAGALSLEGRGSSIFARLAALVRQVFGASRAMIAESLDEWDSFAVLAMDVDDTMHGQPIGFSKTMLDLLVARREAFITEDAITDDAFDEARSVLRQQIRGAMGCPMTVGDTVIGFIYVDDLAKPGRFLPDDLTFLNALGYLVASLVSQERQQRRLEASNQQMKRDLFGVGLVGESDGMRELKGQIASFGASGTVPILIQGESGSGKELVARAIHEASPRANGPFVALNCAAVSENLVDSELFGHRKGAFTGATADKKGKFEIADGGTLFLDEIADMSLATQARVLRAVELGEICPLGMEQPKRVSCRLLAASHKNLIECIERGAFRRDLYYRLAVVTLVVPPLRDRRDDIPLLAETFVANSCGKMGKVAYGIEPAAVSALQRYSWPGNVRELRNEIERAAILCNSKTIKTSDLSARILGKGDPREAMVLLGHGPLDQRYSDLDDQEKALICEALQLSAGRVVQAAELLGISRVKLNTRIARHELEDFLKNLRGR